MELSSLGLRSICVDLGWFRTCLADPNYRVKHASDVEDYKALADAIEARLQGSNVILLNLTSRISNQQSYTLQLTMGLSLEIQLRARESWWTSSAERVQPRTNLSPRSWSSERIVMILSKLTC